MKNHIFSSILSISLILFFVSSFSFAQDRPTRFVKQHNSQSLRKNLKTTEKMLMEHIQNDSTNSKLTAVQTFRELEQIFPDNSFNSFIEPLSGIVQNEELGTQLRILSAIALDELHSDIGDRVIYKVSKTSNNESVKNICTAISFEISKTVENQSK